jgi:hypothetical protein
MIPTAEELIKFIKSKDIVNFSIIAKHFNIKNNTVSDIILDLERKKLVEVSSFGGSKIVKIKEDKMKKKGQVTIYFIIGLVIVMVLGILFYYKGEVIKNIFQEGAETTKVPKEFEPLKNYLDTCIQDITLNGAELLGSQGGYINIPNDGLPLNPAIPFTNKLDIFGDLQLQVPYWFYEANNGVQKYQIPTINNMQDDLKDYINFNLNTCLNNFTSFPGFEITEFNELNTNTEIRDNKIFVKILSDIKVKYKNNEVNFDAFSVSVNSPLGKLYNIAKEILEKQDKENFFEEKTIDMLVLYDEIPYHGESFTCSPRMWFVENVKKDIKPIIKANIEAVNPNNKGYYNFKLDAKNSLINFIYSEDWPFYLSVNGGEQVLKEESSIGENSPAAAFLSTFFCLNNYHFVYDIKYPILVSLNEGNYFFQYALQVIIDNNQPKLNTKGAYYIGDTNSRICRNKNSNSFVQVTDEKTGENIQDAKIELSCVGTICDIGKTGEEGLNAQVPACTNAQIIASKEGYHKNSVTLDTLDQSLVNIELKQYSKKNLEVKIIEGNSIRIPKKDEFVSFILTNKENDYTIFANNQIEGINLLPGKYHIQSFIVKDYPNGLKLNKENLEYCSDFPKAGVLGLIGIKEKKCFNTQLEETKLEKVIVGGADFDFEITNKDLNKGDNLVLYSFYNKVPNNIKEMTDMYNIILRNSDSTNFRKPIIK